MKIWYAVALAGALSGCGGGAVTLAPGPPANTSQHTQLRDQRYCEVIPSVQTGSTVTTYVYNTLGFNNCPQAQWSALTVSEVDQEYGSQSAQLNGPRHWTIDALSASGATANAPTFTFGGIQTGLRAIIQTPAGQPTVGNQFYVPNQVQRDTVWFYNAGQPIFELTDPSGNVYVMQSYAQIVDPALTYAQLSSLGSILTLPAGWTYSTQVLATALQLPSNGLATVVNDNLADSYQLLH